jgi:hypothetical protein
MKRILGAVAVVVGLAVTGMVLAQSLPTITVQKRVGRVFTVAASASNATTVVTTNFTYLNRAYLLIINTNASVSVTVYEGSTTNVALATLATNGGQYKVEWPIIENGTFGVRSDGAAVPVQVTEWWGQ